MGRGRLGTDHKYIPHQAWGKAGDGVKGVPGAPCTRNMRNFFGAFFCRTVFFLRPCMANVLGLVSCPKVRVKQLFLVFACELVDSSYLQLWPLQLLYHSTCDLREAVVATTSSLRLHPWPLTTQNTERMVGKARSRTSRRSTVAAPFHPRGYPTPHSNETIFVDDQILFLIHRADAYVAPGLDSHWPATRSRKCCGHRVFVNCCRRPEY